MMGTRHVTRSELPREAPHWCDEDWVFEWQNGQWHRCYRVSDMLHLGWMLQQKRFAVSLARFTGKCMPTTNRSYRRFEDDWGNVGFHIQNPVDDRLSYKRRHLSDYGAAGADNIAKCRDDQMLDAGQQIDIDAYIRS